MINTKRIFQAPTYKIFKDCLERADELVNGSRVGRPQEVLDNLTAAYFMWSNFKGFLALELKEANLDHVINGPPFRMVTQLTKELAGWVKGEQVIRFSELPIYINQLNEWVHELEKVLKYNGQED